MHSDVTVCFSPRETYDYHVDATADAQAQASARDWLARTYAEFGCEPTRPTGKVLLLDKIFSIALAAGAEKFARDPGWGEEYARAVALALERNTVNIDMEKRTVS